MILVAVLRNLNLKKKVQRWIHENMQGSNQNGTVHRKIIRWVGQNDLFSSKDGQAFWTQQKADVSESYFFPDVPRNQKYSCFLQTLWLCLVFSYFKYG